MTHKVHKIILSSDYTFGRRLPPHAVGVFLAELPRAVCFSVSMALRSRSTHRGKRPGWLNRATDIRFVDMETNGESTLFFEAPSLGEAASEFYAEPDLFWKPPSADDTGFDLLGDVLADVEAANADSERFDRPLLWQLLRFRDVFRRAFTAAHLESRRYQLGHRAHLTLPVLQTAERFFTETPASRRVRVVGKLDMVRVSNRTFGLTLSGGQEVRGGLVERDMDELAPLLNKQVLVFGKAVFRPSGRLLRVDVDEFRAATEADQFFAKLPMPMARTRTKPTPREREKAAEGLRAVIGKWPGDETDEQIHAALEELS
jgi:hypothetical protein